MSKHKERRRSRSRSRERLGKGERRGEDSREKQRQRRRRSNSPEESRSYEKSIENQGRNRDWRRGNRYFPRNRGRDRGDQHYEWGQRPIKREPQSPKAESKKAGPNFKLSGKLAEDTNIYNGIVIKYNEPAEARKPKRRWRLYAFKGDTELPMLPIHRQSAYLLGRERKVADIPIDHPSCSKQHAVLQFRVIKYKREDDTEGKRVRPYIIDLESSNGTYVNNNKIEPRRYVELLEKDVIKFGFSTREYVILHEESKDEDDEVDESEVENPT